MSNWLASQEGFSIQLKKFKDVLIVFEPVFSNAVKLKLDAKCDQNIFQKKTPKFNFCFGKMGVHQQNIPFLF
jgi:hypothetical protein